MKRPLTWNARINSDKAASYSDNLLVQMSINILNTFQITLDTSPAETSFSEN